MYSSKALKFALLGVLILCAPAAIILAPLSAVTAQNAVKLEYGKAVSGTLAAGQTATYSFTAASGDKIAVNMATTGGDLDPMVSLYDPQGKLIGESSNQQKYVAALQGIVLSQAGSYRLVVSNKVAQGTGEYGLSVLQESTAGLIYYDERPDDRENFQLSEPLNTTDVTYRLTNTQPGFDPGVVRGVVARAFKAWSDVTDLTFREVSSGNANFVIEFSPIDGSSNVLGQACPPSSPCAGEIQFDSEERWTMEPELRSQREISFLAVATHEFGHAVGLLHSNNPDALMYYAYSPYNLTPGQDDVAGVQRLYGPSRGRANNSPTSIPGGAQNPAVPSVNGTISNDQFQQFWDFGVEAGDTVNIIMRRTSGNLDAILVLLDANNNILAYDDDSAGNRDAALINIRVPQQGTYTVAATRYEQAQGFTAGNYTLTISYNDPVAPTAVRPQATPRNQGGRNTGDGYVQAGRAQSNSISGLPSLDSTLDQPFDQAIQPTAQIRNATVSRGQSYVWILSWCAVDQATVQANTRNINVSFAVNGDRIDPNLITRTAPQESDGLSCVAYLVTLSGWSGNTLTLSRTLTFTRNTFDGTLVYAAGDYVDQYNVTVR